MSVCRPCRRGLDNTRWRMYGVAGTCMGKVLFSSDFSHAYGCGRGGAAARFGHLFRACGSAVHSGGTPPPPGARRRLVASPHRDCPRMLPCPREVPHCPTVSIHSSTKAGLRRAPVWHRSIRTPLVAALALAVAACGGGGGGGDGNVRPTPPPPATCKDPRATKQWRWAAVYVCAGRRRAGYRCAGGRLHRRGGEDRSARPRLARSPVA